MGRQEESGGFRTWLPVFALALVLVALVAVVRSSDTPAEPVAVASSPVSAPSVREPSPRPVALFVGDSYTAGVGAGSGAARWTSITADRSGWVELNLGRTGTGYTARSTPDACGYSVCPNYLEMARRGVMERPDVVVVSGGQNDTVVANADFDRERKAIADTFGVLRAGLPDALIVAVGPKPLWGTSPTLLAIDAEVRRAVESVGGLYVSMIDPPVLDPTFLLDDGIHVGDRGHEAIAERVLEEIGRFTALTPEPAV